jgi:hypothetical protein
MTTLQDVHTRAQVLSKSRDLLGQLLRTMEAQIETIKTGSLPDIKRAARQIIKQHDELTTLIVANPAMFAKPRTHIVDGLKFGLQKRPGMLMWEDDAVLCERIHKLCKAGDLTAEQADMLIARREKPVAKALEKLDGKLLKRLGVTVTADTDEPLIKSVDGEVEKAINAIIKDATQDANAAVAV